MNKLILLCICTIALAMNLFAQTPTATPIASPSPAAAMATMTPIATATASSSDLADRIHQKLEKKFRGHHGIVIDSDHHKGSDEDIPAMVIPLVGIVFMTIFGAPVLIVMTIGLITLLVTRMRQRTIRVMVEKGQPVPAELLAPATRAVRQRSDVRRGVVWTMIGVGLIVWLGAINDWEGGAWSFGLIPFLIGVGYLMVWKLEGKNSVPPPPPAP
ncbi:MAG TPA: DUF6249 domain-containing protein [Candidatus Udaeobacter sp.]|jgi:hypothetical protein|nr:DUF6249 domain-containing protein [Candidatus Udaeobacter sp.]